MTLTGKELRDQLGLTSEEKEEHSECQAWVEQRHSGSTFVLPLRTSETLSSYSKGLWDI